MKKFWLSLVLLSGPVLASGQIYHAGETPQQTSSASRWELSLGWTQSHQSIQDRVGEQLLKNEEAVAARGLFYPVRFLGIGIEGNWFNKKGFPQENTFKDTRYGIISKWVLTQDTTPRIYLLAGAGRSKQNISYIHQFSRSNSMSYGLVGVGLEASVYKGLFVGVEGQAVYNTHHKIDPFLYLHHRWEKVLSLRGGIRF